MAQDPPLSAGEVKNNNQLAMGASKAGSGWQESIDNHTTTMAGDNKWWEYATDDEGKDSNKEGKGGKGMAKAIRVTGDEKGKGNKEGNGIIDKGGVWWQGQWWQQREQWQQGWRASEGDEGNGNGDGDGNGNNMGNGDGNEAGRRQRGQAKGGKGDGDSNEGGGQLLCSRR